jgi:aldose 1-epimerase
MTAVLEQVGPIDGVEVLRATLANSSGMRAGVLSFGATLQFLTAPSSGGPRQHLALGFDTAAEYAQKSGHLGATVGRFANRIAHGRFTLDGRDYELDRNEGGLHHLHGGPGGFARRHWQVAIDERRSAARFTLRSADGDQGYPGTLDASCTWTLGDDDVLTIEMEAQSDAPTPVNLANHTYWNLAGAGTIGGHHLEVEADEVLAVDEATIPWGPRQPVAGSALDFRRLRPIAQEQGVPRIDHCYVLRPASGLRRVAKLVEPAGRRSLELWADRPGVQVYTAFKLATTGRGGAAYGPGSGLCLETQDFPNAPNVASFPSAILRPGERYRHRMEHRFEFDA